jgi:hypothetical protein
MTNGQNAAGNGLGGGKAYSVNVQEKAQPRKSCSFCYFVLGTYPTLSGMTEVDTETFRSHLQKAHGLKDEIQA